MLPRATHTHIQDVSVNLDIDICQSWKRELYIGRAIYIIRLMYYTYMHPFQYFVTHIHTLMTMMMTEFRPRWILVM